MSSVQFRSRIKPAFDYSDKLNSYGVCCGTTGADNKTIKSFTECFNEGGHFIPVVDGNTGSVSCPDSDTRLGCCCACSYVTPGQLDQIPTLDNNGNTETPYLASGFVGGVARCECDRLGGKWTEGSCPSSLTPSTWQATCMKSDNSDARAPRSCCHLEFDEDTGWPTGVKCKDVCSSGDCARLGTETYPSVYGDNRCAIPLRIGDATTQCVSSPYYSYMFTRSSLYEGFDMGSCYTLEDNNGSIEYTCSITPQALCSGYWVAEQDENNAFCTSTYQPSNPQKSAGKYQVQTMGLTAFNNLGLTAGDSFQGGVFVGIFQPPVLNGKSSTLYGNLSFATPTSTNMYADSIGATGRQWAVIVDETQYSVPFLQSDEIDVDYTTSLWDGFYNTYGNGTFKGISTAMTNTIRYADRKGFIDYYIPSIYELYFYAAYLNRNNIDTIGNLISSSLFNTKYLNQVIQRSKISGNGFIYGLGVNKNYTTNYRTILLEKKSIETALFFRRIVLE
jgi:hypothetical protein